MKPSDSAIVRLLRSVCAHARVYIHQGEKVSETRDIEDFASGPHKDGERVARVIKMPRNALKRQAENSQVCVMISQR